MNIHLSYTTLINSKVESDSASRITILKVFDLEVCKHDFNVHENNTPLLVGTGQFCGKIPC